MEANFCFWFIALKQDMDSTLEGTTTTECFYPGMMYRYDIRRDLKLSR
jgi:hypothetical protein